MECSQKAFALFFERARLPVYRAMLVTAIRARKRGRIGDDQIAPIVDFKLTPDRPPLVTYLGYAKKPADR